MDSFNCEFCDNSIKPTDSYHVSNGEKKCHNCFYQDLFNTRIFKELKCSKCNSDMGQAIHGFKTKTGYVMYVCTECFVNGQDDHLTCHICGVEIILGNPNLQGGTGTHCNICCDPVCEDCLRTCKYCKDQFIGKCCVSKNKICKECSNKSDKQDENDNNNDNNNDNDNDNNDSDSDSDDSDRNSDNNDNNREIITVSDIDSDN